MSDLCELNSKFEEAFKNGESSLFGLSFELLKGEDVKKELEASTRPLPYLRIACYLQDFYDYANGRDFRNLWLTHNKRVDLAKTWEDVYHRAVSQYEVKSKAWILSGECHGQSSDVWRVIKACAAKKSEDGADRFDPSSYVNDEVPRQLALILDDYQSGGVDGAEFVSFIEAFQRKGKDSEAWMVPLVERALQHFPSSIDFTAAGYLKWDGDSTERAEMILGVDHVRGVVSGRLSINGQVSTATIATGFKAFALPPSSSDSHEVRFLGVTEKIPASPVGVYYRYQLGAGARRSWWVKVRSDGTFPYNRDEILLVFPDGSNGASELGHGIVTGPLKRTRVFCAGRWYLFVSARIETRPETTNTVDVGDFTLAFAGVSPAIRLGTETARSIWAEDAVVVDAATSVEVVGLSDAMSCSWTVNGKDVADTGYQLELPNPQGGLGESRVKATIRKNGRICHRLSINVFHLPSEVAEALRSGAALPAGWSLEIERDEDCGECIALRVQGRRAAFLAGPNNVILPIYIEDRSSAWWVERDAVQSTVKGSFRDVSLFTRMSDLDGASLCIPADMIASSLSVAGKTIPVSTWQPKDGVIQIPLDKIVGDTSGCEFCFAGNVPELKFFLDGHLVGVVAAVPNNPTLCRHADSGELGVFLPNRKRTWSEKFLVLAYRDTPSVAELYAEPEQLTDEPLEWKRDGGDQFASVAVKLNAYLEKHPRGEVFVVLVNSTRWNKYSCTVANPFFLKPESDCQTLVVRTDSSQYTATEAAVAKRLKSAWGEHLSSLAHGHPLRRTRISAFEGAIKYEECEDYWRDVAATPQEWRTAFRVMLDSGYNPLMEPEWFNQSVDELIDKVRVRQGRSRVTQQLAEEVLKVLLDNQDAKSESFSGIKGEGLCAALVSRRQILNFSDLVPINREAYFLNREQTILSSKPIDKLGILGVFESSNGFVARHPLVQAKCGEIVFNGPGGREVIKRHATRGDWRRTDDRKRVLSFQSFELSEPKKAPRLIVAKTEDIDPDEIEWAHIHCSNDEFQRVIGVGLELSGRLDRPWTRELFTGTFMELKNKGCCDFAIARSIGLVACVQSILADKDIGACLKFSDEGYALVQRLTRALFCCKYVEGDDSLWRETMRFITAYLGIHAYLDISPEAIQDNAF